MSKTLPYYKFHPAEWIKGDITLCDMEAQGVFINLCSYYWLKDCSITLANAKQRFSKDVASIEVLLNYGIITIDENENIIIKFLDEQMNEFADVSGKRSQAGRLGGLAKAKQMPKFATAKAGNKIREDKRREDKDKKLIEKLTINENYIDIIIQWLKYKRKRGESYKDENSTQLAYDKLFKLSEGEHLNAVKIVENSMANNWAGLFSINKNGSEVNQQKIETDAGAIYPRR